MIRPSFKIFKNFAFIYDPYTFEEGGFTLEVVRATLPPPTTPPAPPLDLLTNIDDKLATTKKAEDDKDNSFVDANTSIHEENIENRGGAKPNSSLSTPLPRMPGSMPDSSGKNSSPVTRHELLLQEDPLNAEALQDESTGLQVDDKSLNITESPQVKRGRGRLKGSKNKPKEPELQDDFKSNQVDYTSPFTRSRQGRGGGSAHATLSPATAFHSTYAAGVDDIPDIVLITYNQAIVSSEAEQ